MSTGISFTKQTQTQTNNKEEYSFPFFPTYIRLLVLHWQLTGLLRHGSGQFPKTSLVPEEEEYCEISKKGPYWSKWTKFFYVWWVLQAKVLRETREFYFSSDSDLVIFHLCWILEDEHHQVQMLSWVNCYSLWGSSLISLIHALVWPWPLSDLISNTFYSKIVTTRDSKKMKLMRQLSLLAPEKAAS